MSNLKHERYHFRIDPFNSGTRLDIFLTRALAPFTRSRVQKLIRDGCVKVCGKPAKASLVVRENFDVEVEVLPPQSYEPSPENIELEVLYEDNDIIAVNKPAGMVSHPASGNFSGTLVNALLAHCSDLSGIGGVLKPGIVHRLDKGTSGVMIAAKNDAAHIALSKQFHDRVVGKIYLALVHGAMKDKTGMIEAPIGRSLGDRKKFSSRTRKGRTALTEWKVLKRFSCLTLLEIKLHTGRTHQIRVHFAECGHPIVGDTLYGGKRQTGKGLSADQKMKIESFPRPALHASELSFFHPVKGTRMKFSAPLPEDISSLLSIL